SARGKSPLGYFHGYIGGLPQTIAGLPPPARASSSDLATRQVASETSTFLRPSASSANRMPPAPVELTTSRTSRFSPARRRPEASSVRRRSPGFCSPAPTLSPLIQRVHLPSAKTRALATAGADASEKALTARNTRVLGCSISLVHQIQRAGPVVRERASCRARPAA